MKKIDILFILNSSCGGSERMSLLYAKILAKSGFSCHLLILQNSISRIFTIEPFIPQGIDYTLLSCRVRYLPFRLYGFIKNLSPAVLFSSLTPNSNFILLYKCLGLLRSSLVVRINNSPVRIKQVSAFHYWLFSLLGRRADLVISQTDDMRLDAISHFHIPEQKIITVVNPVDSCYISQMIREKSPIESGFVNFLAVGRLNAVKDYVTLIRAFAEVRNTILNSRLYILGESSDAVYFNELKSLADSLDVKDSVFFEGFQANPYKYMNDCSVFVHSSTMEGLPNVVLEALSIGKPVVATDCIPIISQLINDGINGYVVSVRDYMSMADRMICASSMTIPPITGTDDPTSLILDIFSKLIDK